MTEEKFIEDFIDMIDAESEIAMETKLEDIEEWDSLSYVSFFANCTSKYKVMVSKDEIKNAVTVADLYKAVNK